MKATRFNYWPQYRCNGIISLHADGVAKCARCFQTFYSTAYYSHCCPYHDRQCRKIEANKADDSANMVLATSEVGKVDNIFRSQMQKVDEQLRGLRADGTKKRRSRVSYQARRLRKQHEVALPSAGGMVEDVSEAGGMGDEDNGEGGGMVEDAGEAGGMDEDNSETSGMDEDTGNTMDDHVMNVEGNTEACEMAGPYTGYLYNIDSDGEVVDTHIAPVTGGIAATEVDQHNTDNADLLRVIDGDGTENSQVPDDLPDMGPQYDRPYPYSDVDDEMFERLTLLSNSSTEDLDGCLDDILAHLARAPLAHEDMAMPANASCACGRVHWRNFKASATSTFVPYKPYASPGEVLKAVNDVNGGAEAESQ
ncbi:hypothetical protein Vafri_19933 [Volvox africanus]|uniref:Uncharacterized protein n=1 Tax=Volvox africanus TaxID=51714 RepID=A0A8J4F953_9CHLO|nr:hypothetical protein Vafri_19933 [Volvox africanus]